MKDIITIAGSPSRTAKSAMVLRLAQQVMEAKGWTGEAIIVRDLPAEDLLHARYESSAIQETHALLKQAQAVIIATPIYKTAYSGVLKTFLDLLPQDALKNKIVLPLATGGSPAHLLALDYALKPVLGALGATQVLRGVYLLDTLITLDAEGTLQLEPGLDLRLQEALNELHFLLKMRRAMAALNVASEF